MSTDRTQHDKMAIERAVLDVYRRENPSTHFLEQSDDRFQSHRAKRVRLYRDCLKLPPRLFKGAALIDFGGGTGEKSIFYAVWGAHCVLVEPNEKSCERARMIFDRFAADPKAHRIVNKSLYDYRPDRPADIVICEGVIQSTRDPEASFRHVASCVAPDGFLVAAISTRSGMFQRMLQRYLVFRFADSDEDIVSLASDMFPEHLARAERFGGRSKRAIIFDQFINPQLDSVSTKQVLEWFRTSGLSLYSAWPPVEPPFRGDSDHRQTVDILDLPSTSAFAEIAWMTHDQDDVEEIRQRYEATEAVGKALDRVVSLFNNVAPGQTVSADAWKEALARYRKAAKVARGGEDVVGKATSFFDEVESALAFCHSNDRPGLENFLARTRHLFRGTVGLGMNYFVGYRLSE